MWECEVCGHLNEDDLETCEVCGAARGEILDEDIYDEYLDEEEGLL